MKYSTIETVPRRAVLMLNTAFAESWSLVKPYHIPKYRPMGMQTQSRKINVQNQKIAFFLGRSE